MSSPNPDPTRRRFLAASAASALALSTGCRSSSSSSSSPEENNNTDRSSFPGDLRFLLQRTSHGYTLESATEVLERGYEDYLEWQLAPESIDDREVDTLLARLPSLTMSFEDLFRTYGIPKTGHLPLTELKIATVLRAVYSRKSLFERTVEFWTDHFNIDHEIGPVRVWKTVDDRDVIRRHALGTFPELLRASAKSGAMLYYLDNYTNTKEAPNENYARELLELHTLGVDGPYEEFDVKNVARCLTGWSVHLPSTDDFSEFQRPTLRDTTPDLEYGRFKFIPERHDNHDKFVLGHHIPRRGGVQDGERILQILIDHPKTADFISRKLCRWFLAYEPPEEIVQAVVSTYRSTGGDIKAMIREIFVRDRLEELGVFSMAKFKRPLHLVISLLRATGARLDDFKALHELLSSLGHLPFGWPTPDGYPDLIEAWSTALLPRWAAMSRLANHDIDGVLIPTEPLMERLGHPPREEMAKAIDDLMGRGAMSDEEFEQVRGFLDDQDEITPSILRQAIALAASSETFQYY